VRERLEHAREGIQLAHHLDDGRARKTAVLIAFSRQRSLLRRSFYQAKNARATIRSSESNLLASLPPSPDITKRIRAAQAEEARMRDDPESGDGMKQLAERAKVQTEDRNRALHIYHHYELAVSALQIAIVLASVSVVTRIGWLAVLGGGLGLAAGVYAALVGIGVV
jgi:hypothetical protein